MPRVLGDEVAERNGVSGASGRRRRNSKYWLLTLVAVVSIALCVLTLHLYTSGRVWDILWDLYVHNEVQD